MKIDGLDWIDWLHRQRERSEAERKRRGISGADWRTGRARVHG